MKKSIMLCCIVAIAVFSMFSLTLKDVVKGDYFEKGFSCTMKMTTKAEGITMISEASFAVKGKNTKIEMKMPANMPMYDFMKQKNIDEYIMYTVEEKGKSVMYTYYPKRKQYVVFADMPEGEEQFDTFEGDEKIQKIGSETFAGVNADKYKVLEEKDGTTFYYIDPAKKIMIGVVTINEESENRIELINTTHSVSDSTFKRPSGYTQTSPNELYR